MEGLRLVELQCHGEEVQELKRDKSELVATNMQLEQKVTQKEVEISRLKTRYQDLVKAVRISRLCLIRNARKVPSRYTASNGVIMRWLQVSYVAKFCLLVSF